MKRYDEEFKVGVIKRFMAGESIAGLSRETGINNQTLHKWKKEMVRGDVRFPRPTAALAQENSTDCQIF